MDRKDLESMINNLRAEKGTIIEQNNSLSKKLASLQNSMTQIEKGAVQNDNPTGRSGRVSVLEIIKNEKAANPDTFRSPPVFQKPVVKKSDDEDSEQGTSLPTNEIKKKLIPPPFNAVVNEAPIG